MKHQFSRLMHTNTSSGTSSASSLRSVGRVLLGGLKAIGNTFTALLITILVLALGLLIASSVLYGAIYLYAAHEGEQLRLEIEERSAVKALQTQLETAPTTTAPATVSPD
jgi:hypothetical protein